METGCSLPAFSLLVFSYFFFENLKAALKADNKNFKIDRLHVCNVRHGQMGKEAHINVLPGQGSSYTLMCIAAI